MRGVSCTGAFAGAVCPSTSVAVNTPPFSRPRIDGTIARFPAYAVVRLRVHLQLAAQPGFYTLEGRLDGPVADPIVATNSVLSALYVRPLLLDLATGFSSTHPAIGGSDGLLSVLLACAAYAPGRRRLSIRLRTRPGPCLP